MDIARIEQQDAKEARGIVIVIDVIRAFTVASYAFAGGAKSIWLVRTVEEAQALRQRDPQALLAGEIGGRLIPGFDFNNSPVLIASANIVGRQLIQRTGAGTQGAVGASNATYTLLCALTNASATAAYARTLAAQTGLPITLLPTNNQHPRERNEDHFCADYLEALLTDSPYASEVLNKSIHTLRTTNRFIGWAAGDFNFPIEDIPAILAANHFSFAMLGTREEWEGVTHIDARRVDLPWMNAKCKQV
jgi:2-phosphosulfolactate phosphatase